MKSLKNYKENWKWIDWEGVIWKGTILMLAVLLICGVVDIFFTYRLSPNEVSIEENIFSGVVKGPITYDDNASINKHFCVFWNAYKFNTKVKTLMIECYGNQKAGSFDIIHQDGVNVDYYPNNVVVSYQLNLESIRDMYINLDGQESTIQNAIKGGVYKLFSENNLTIENLQDTVDSVCNGYYAKIVDISYTTNINN